MLKQAFGRHQVSVAALGTSDFGGRIPEALARDLMDAYDSIGGNFIDTARVYGDYVTPRGGLSEAAVGRWLRDNRCRERYFLSTKGGHPKLGDMHRGRLSREEVHRDIHQSLEALQTDRVEIYWLHRDDPARPVGDIMETLESLREEGLAEMTGVSNWRTERIQEANGYARAHGLHPLDANQPRFSLAEQFIVEDDTLAAMDAGMWRMHEKTGLVCCCFSSQAKGFFTKLDTLGEAGLSQKARRRYYNEENLAVYRRMQALKAETGLSIGAIALAWLISQPFPTFAMTGASRVEQVLALSETAGVRLTNEQRDAIRRM